MTDTELVELAEELAEILQHISVGSVLPYGESVQKWATDAMLRLDQIEYSNQPLADAVESCLVDVLSCDNASWDTTPVAFLASLNRLKCMISSLGR